MSSSSSSSAAVNGLVFSGGLIKAVTLVGALKAFENSAGDCGKLRDLRVVAGASSGAIIAALLVCGWNADEIADQLIERTQIVGDLIHHNPFSINKLSLLWKLVRGRGLDDGNLLYETLGRMLSRHARSNDADITFAEAHRQFGRALIVTTSCYSTLQLQLFSLKTTPDVPIRTALRASAAYPCVYLPADIAGRVYYDGGLMCNYPLMYVQQQYPEYKDTSYGFVFDFSQRNEAAFAWIKNEWPGITDIMINVVSMLYFRIAYLESQLTHRYDELTMLIPIDSSQSLLKITADPEEMRRMYAFGLRFATEWIAHLADRRLSQTLSI
jgi:predicted acylesterase/phospholipase RssA